MSLAKLLTSLARLVRSEETVYALEEILPLILASVGLRPRLNAAAPAGLLWGPSAILIRAPHPGAYALG